MKGRSVNLWVVWIERVLRGGDALVFWGRDVLLMGTFGSSVLIRRLNFDMRTAKEGGRIE
jgi:hypothetical protein